MNILIVGLGSIAKKHITALKYLNNNAKIYALRSNVSSDNIEGVINIYNLNELNVDIDFAIISNPTQSHYKFIEILADKGVNLFIEKPPVSTLVNLDNLVSKIQKKNVKTYVACNLRFHPCIKYLKDFLSLKTERRINEVNIYCGSYLPEWRPDKNFKDIYSANPEMGGGVHLDLFHELDYMHWLFGKPISTHCIKRRSSSLDIKACDYANYIAEYKNYTISVILNYYRRDVKRTIEILFEDETWTIDLIKNNIKESNNIIFQADKFNILDTYSMQMEYFINGLQSNQPYMNNFTESLEVLKTCLSNE